MSSILIKNIKEIVTMDRERTRLKGYSLLINDNKISKIACDIKFPAEEIIDGSDYFLYPGLINTHPHFYQTLTRNIPQVQNVELFNWLKYLYPIWARLTPQAVYYSSLVAMGELLKTGCTTAVDQFYVFPKGQPKELVDEEFRAAQEIGIRFHGSRGSMSLSEKDGGLPPDSVVQTEEEILSDSQRVIEKFHDYKPFAMQRVALSPCSPFSVTENIPYMLKKKVAVGLAVDGSASNDSSNMIAELKAAFLMHRLIYGISSISAEEVLAMATNGGRDVLNQPEIGSLEEGKAADMFLINTKRLGFAGGLSDSVSALVTSGDSQIVDITIVNGKIVVCDGKLVNIDEEKVAEIANEISQKMIEG